MQTKLTCSYGRGIVAPLDGAAAWSRAFLELAFEHQQCHLRYELQPSNLLLEVAPQRRPSPHIFCGELQAKPMHRMPGVDVPGGPPPAYAGMIPRCPGVCC